MARCFGGEQVGVIVVSSTCIRVWRRCWCRRGGCPIGRKANMGNVPQNKPVTAAADFLHRHTTHTRGGRCLLVCCVRSRLDRVAHFDYDVLLAARLTWSRTPPKQRSSGSLMALYVPNANTTGMVVAVESHLEFHRKIDQVWWVITGLVACDADVPCMLWV